MLYGQIDYINLLPFHVYIKGGSFNQKFKMRLGCNKGVPSKINQYFSKGKVECAFISSIRSKKYKKSSLGIVSYGEVFSVLVVDGNKEDDSASQTSNALREVLNISGRVIIGDEAYKYYLGSKDNTKLSYNFKDLSLEWYKKYRLPFVFATFCYKGDSNIIKKIEAGFLKKRQKIPYYILKKTSKNSGIPIKDILYYLNNINYHFNHLAKRSLKLFFKELDKKRIKVFK